MVGVEGPGDAAEVEAVLQLGEHAAVAHALDALALVALGHVGADEGKGDGVELVVEHGVHVVNELARDRVLVGGETEAERGHGPFDGGPVEGGEARADAERAAAEVAAGGGEDGGARVVLEDVVFEREQVGPGGGEKRVPVVGAHAVCEHRGDLLGGETGVCEQVPRAVAGGGVLDESPDALAGLEAAVFPDGERVVRENAGAERGPVETEVGADAGIGRDAKLMLEEKGVQPGEHGRG